jgi:CheY-like chemotaxis protein
MKEPKTECKKRVLVVDGDQDFRRYITDCIEAEGISCITATSVSEALEALARNKVSVLIVDWFLDHVASDVVRKARSGSALMPIIVMSGKPYNVKMDALLADADEFEKTLGQCSGKPCHAGWTIGSRSRCLSPAARGDRGA